MAILTGISGLAAGDGKGGKIALSIQTRVLRLLSDQHLSYTTATIRDLGQLQAGTVSYYVPEVVQTEDYGDGTTPSNNFEAGLVSVNIDKRFTSKYDIETFDITRLSNSTEILNQVAIGLALAIQATLNAEFLNYILTQFKQNGSLANANQTLVLDKISSKGGDNFTPDDMYGDWLKMEYLIASINQKYNKQMLGVPKADVLSLLSPFGDIGLMRAFRNQPNQLGSWQIAKTLQGKQIGNVKYLVDTMFQNSIAAGASFSKNKSFDFTKFVGIMLHNEAVAFPVNIKQISQVIDPLSANLRFIAKVQYGAGILRPSLIYALTTQADINKAK